jgi:hypothetical protein
MRLVRRLRWEVRSIAGRFPWLCRRLVRHSGEYPTDQTEIVIEGFPRTGNTFAVIAFQAAQPRVISIAHHVHAPAPILDAVRRRTPAIVLVREPEEAVLSFVLRLPELSLRQALRSYVRFYRPLARRRGGFVVGAFDRVVTDLGSVIREVNQRFGTDFVLFEATEPNLAEVMDELDVWDRNTFGQGPLLERGRARPSAARAGLKDTLRPRYRAPRLSRLRRRAESLYESLIAPDGNDRGRVLGSGQP